VGGIDEIEEEKNSSSKSSRGEGGGENLRVYLRTRGRKGGGRSEKGKEIHGHVEKRSTFRAREKGEDWMVKKKKKKKKKESRG